MWVRKSTYEISREREARKRKAGKYFFWLFFVILIAGLWYVGSLENLAAMYDRSPRWMSFVLVFPLMIWFGYRGYVLHGNAFNVRPGKVCIGCGIGLGYSDDGWGFQVRGNKEKQWYQIRVCKTPEKCDIANLYELKWVENCEDEV